MVGGHSNRQRYRSVAVVIAIALVLGVALTVSYVLPSYVENKVRSTLARLETQFGVAITVDSVDTYGALEVVLSAIMVRDPKAPGTEPAVLRIGEIRVDVDVFSLLSTKPRLRTVRVDKPELHILRRQDGTNNVASWRKRISAWDMPEIEPMSTSSESVLDRIDPRLPVLQVSGGRLVISDATLERSLLPSFAPKQIVLSNGSLTAENTSMMLDKLELKIVATADIDQFGGRVEGNLLYDRRTRRRRIMLTLPEPCTIPFPDGRELTIGQALWSGGRTITLRDVGFDSLAQVEEIRAQWKQLPAAGDTAFGWSIGDLSRIELRKPVIDSHALLLLASWRPVHHATSPDKKLPSLDVSRKPVVGTKKRPKLKVDKGVAVRGALKATYEYLGQRILELAKGIRKSADILPVDEVVIRDGRLSPGPEQTTFSMQFSRTDSTSSLTFNTDIQGTVSSFKAKVAADTGDIQVSADVPELPLARLEPYAPSSVVLNDAKIQKTALRLQYFEEDQSVTMDGDFHLSGLTLQVAPVASVPMENVSFGGNIRATYSPVEMKMSVAAKEFRFGNVPVRGQFDMTDGLGEPIVHLELQVPRIGAQAVVNSLPKALIGRLSSMKTSGDIAWSLTLDLDTRDMNSLEYDSEGHEYGFRVESLGERLALNTLRKRFKHRVQEPGGGIKEFTTGPGSRGWTPLRRVSEWMAKVLTTTEDGTFYRHQGLAFFAIRDAFVQNLERGRFYRGASTLTQQLVKNLFLIREKTVARKLQEMFLAWHMDRHMTKKEILALYVNVVEFGPRIYGIRKAAKYYFDKVPADLDPLECAFLASMLPNPKRYHYQFRRGEVTEAWRIALRRTLEVMVKRKKMTRRQLESYAPYSPRFRERRK